MIDKSNPKYQRLIEVSNPDKVLKNANAYLGKGNFELFISNTKNHKYMIINKENGRKINFGNISYYDYTKHNDETRRQAYLARSEKIKGNWRDSKFSPNNLSRALLWDAK